MSHRIKVALSIGALVIATAAGAQEGQPERGGPPPGGQQEGGRPGSGGFARQQPITIKQLRPNVYEASGAGGNVGIVVGDKGVTVIDTTVFAATGRELLEKIAGITPKPVTTVIVTHSDIDHVGGLDAFPAGVTIIAQANAAKRIAAASAAGKGPHVSSEHLPTKTVETGETLTANGVAMQLHHWGPAHTDGDLVVYLPAQHVLFAGDILTLDQFRTLIHPEVGGSAKGWVGFARNMLKLDATTIVPGHGEVQTKPQVAERVKLVADEQAEVARLAAQGKTLAEVQAAVGDPPPGPVTPNPAGRRFVTFSEAAYREATAGK